MEEKIDIFKNHQKGAEIPPKHYQKGRGGKKRSEMGLREERAARQDGAQQESEGKGVPLPNS